MRAGRAEVAKGRWPSLRRARESSRAALMSTRSGRKCSMSDVSTSPPWMPSRRSRSEKRSVGQAEAGPARLHREHVAAHAKLAGDDAHDLLVAAMRIDDDELAHPGAMHGKAELRPRLDRCRGRQRQRARRIEVLVGLADAWTGRMRTSSSGGNRRRPSAASPRRSARRCRPADAGRAARPPRAAGRRSWRRCRCRRIRSPGTRSTRPGVRPMLSCVSLSRGPRGDRLDLHHEFRARETGDDHQRRGGRRVADKAVAHRHVSLHVLARR